MRKLALLGSIGIAVSAVALSTSISMVESVYRGANKGGGI